MRGNEVLIIAGVIVLLFGGSQIPKLAKSLGQASKEFKKGQDEKGEAKSPEKEDKSPEKEDKAE